ncbi:MAG: carboxypeptidase-like regulatory domain-containing protein [Defluviitaleaceae bacterium]|nr:carboxypeptidase-like regulatory domain-containing protein [Defluviitaleaceae bacterium]
MGTGFLKVVTTAAHGAMPIAGVSVTVLHNAHVMHELTTNESGLTETIALEAPPRELSLDPHFTGIPYSVYDVKAVMSGFATITVHDVKILDGEISILPIIMIPMVEPGEAIDIWTPRHNLTYHLDNHGQLPPMINAFHPVGNG